MRKLYTLWIASTLLLIADKKIIVDLSQQIAFAYENRQLQFYGRISSGKAGRRTPTGHFRILEKDIDHVSNLWPAPNGGAKMHYMLRLTRDGIAMHLGPVPNYPASHGCIRMQNGFAQKMYFWAEKGTPVTVKGTPPATSPKFTLPSYTSKTETQYYTEATRKELALESARHTPSALSLLGGEVPIYSYTPTPSPESKVSETIAKKTLASTPKPPAKKPAVTLQEALKKRGIRSHPLAEISTNHKLKKLLEEAKQEVPRPKHIPKRVDPLKVLSGR